MLYPMQITPYADVNRMLELLQSRIGEALEASLVGLYLSGSLVTGDFDLDVSDIDLVAVTASALTEAELDRLETMHREIAIAEKTWDNRIEVIYVSVDALKTFRVRPSKIAVTSPGEPFHTLDAGTDWLINWYVVREKSITLLGPSPETLIDSISKQELIEWVRDHVKGWREWIKKISHRNGQVYATLTMCRALCTVTTGDFRSKRQSALWVEHYLPEWAPFIKDALRSWREDWYKEGLDPEVTRPETERFVNVVIDQIVGTE
jgi:predicted nucleotidyltransferase